MSDLSKLKIKPAYHKGEDDIANGFYIPCLNHACSYERAVGYFSSTIYFLAWDGLKDFVKSGGKIKIVCSPVLNENDLKAIEDGYHQRLQEDLSINIASQIESFLNDSYLNKPTRILATLVSLEVIDIKIAIPISYSDVMIHRLFHDKVGIFRDKFDNTIVFKGSMNESLMGLSNDGNIESIDVFVSWEKERDEIRIKNEIEYFEKIWDNKYPTLNVIDFPDVAKDIFSRVSEPNAWENWIDEVNEGISISQDP